MKNYLLKVWAFILALFTPKTVFNFDGKMTRHINDVHKKATSLSHYDDYEESYDDYEESYANEFFEHVEAYKRKGANPAKAREMAYNKMTVKHGTNFQKTIGRQVKGRNELIGKNPKYPNKAMFDITITRVTKNITQALPVPLFAGIHYNASYLSIINQFLPAGISIASIAVNNTGSVVITYVDTITIGNPTDTIIISCNQVPYITFLASSNFDVMTITKFRYQISDITKLQQFSQRFAVATKSLFGKSSADDVTVSAFKDPKQFQNGIIDVDNPISIDKETGIFVNLIAEEGFSITLSQFVESFVKYNASTQLYGK